MVGGMLMAFLAGVHFWWPKMTGRMYPESLSKLAAVVTFIGFRTCKLPAAGLILGLPGACRAAATRIRRELQVLNVALSTAG